MKLWGLTGGIASGKSTVNKILGGQGVQVLDADAIYHSLLAPTAEGQASTLALAIAAAFGDILRADGTVDRRRLAAQVFADDAARQKLEGLTHPAVAAAAQHRLSTLAQLGHSHCVYDVPLLYERDMAARFAGVIVVWVPQALQVARLMARDGLDAAAVQARFKAQMPLDEKRQRADWVIDNSDTVATTATQVAAIWARIQQGPP